VLRDIVNNLQDAVTHHSPELVTFLLGLMLFRQSQLPYSDATVMVTGPVMPYSPPPYRYVAGDFWGGDGTFRDNEVLKKSNSSTHGTSLDQRFPYASYVCNAEGAQSFGVIVSYNGTGW
jgi:hypothetical protein